MSVCVCVKRGDLQRDYVGVGIVHSDGDGIFLILVSGVVVSSSLQEQTRQPGGGRGAVCHVTSNELTRLYSCVFAAAAPSNV